MEDFDQIRLFVYFGTKSSTFGAFFLKILHFWLRKLEKPPLWEVFFFFLLDFLSKLEKPPLLVVFFSKVRISFRIDFQSSTFGVFFSPKSSTFDPSERNKVQEHFKITTQLIFLMPPTSPASFVQIGAL